MEETLRAVETEEADKSADFLDENGSDIRPLFVSKFKSYLFSGVWTDSTSNRRFLSLVRGRLSKEQIMAQMGISENTYNMRVHVITKKVNSLLFGGDACPEGISSLTDARQIRKCFFLLDNLEEPFSILEEFDERTYNWVIDRIGDAKPREPKTTGDYKEYFAAMIFMMQLSRSCILSRLDKISPDILAKVYNELNAVGYSETLFYCEGALKELTSGLQSISVEDIKKLVNEEKRLSDV